MLPFWVTSNKKQKSLCQRTKPNAEARSFPTVRVCAVQLKTKDQNMKFISNLQPSNLAELRSTFPPGIRGTFRTSDQCPRCPGRHRPIRRRQSQGAANRSDRPGQVKSCGLGPGIRACDWPRAANPRPDQAANWVRPLGGEARGQGLEARGGGQ